MLYTPCVWKKIVLYFYLLIEQHDEKTYFVYMLKTKVQTVQDDQLLCFFFVAYMI